MINTERKPLFLINIKFRKKEVNESRKNKENNQKGKLDKKYTILNKTENHIIIPATIMTSKHTQGSRAFKSSCQMNCNFGACTDSFNRDPEQDRNIHCNIKNCAKCVGKIKYTHSTEETSDFYIVILFMSMPFTISQSILIIL